MISKFDVTVTPLNVQRRIHLYLPDDYDQSDDRYPVMYFYDGHNLFFDEDATYGKSWGLKEFLEYYDKQFIIVGIECSHEGNERLNEYCPFTLENSYFGNITGKGEIFMDWLVGELKPFIDENYRTIPFRECTGIAGSSMGGLMALYSVVHYNEYFSKAACLSSAIGMCFSQIKQEIDNSKLNSDTRVYMDWGSNESRDKNGLAYSTNNQLEIAHALMLKGALTYPHLVVGGRHNESTWEQQVPVFMDYLWK